MKQKKKQIIIISCIILTLVLSLSFAVWFMHRPGRPVIVTEGKAEAEWYDPTGTEFTIDTADELFEFAELSSKYNFEGQTIKLGADIVVNEGNAEDWDTEMPERIWYQPIDNFAGTFDGQGHTISGIFNLGYLYKVNAVKLTPLPAGLFSNTKESCVIKNFKLVNSYFLGDLQDGAGTISACGGGTFESIYSNATLVSYKYYNGGIIGMASESTTIRNCWYDGKMEIIGGYARYTGGLIGRSVNFDDSTFTIEHCLVTATMNNETTKCGVGMGALVGNVRNDSTVTVDDCFVASKLTNEWGAAVGSVYGVSEERGTVNMTNTYALDDGYKRLVGAILGTANGMPVGYPRELVTGYGGYQWTTLDFDNYWSIVEDGTPILKTFADVTASLEDVERYVDTSWYTNEATEYVLMDKADLYGFSILSQSWDFEGKTVKLGADIVVNLGKASSFAKQAPALEWISISPKSKPFAGTFDGKMRTISGLYMDTDAANSGLFSATGDTSIIKNLKLKNSYFKSEATDLGSIAGQGRGAFDTVYSDATVVASKARSGGLIGMAYGTKVSMKNCWFAGSVTNTSNDKGHRGTGGLIGVVYDGGSAKIQSCLNTGTIDVRSYTVNQNKTGNPNVAPVAGGLVGWVKTKESTISIKDSLNTGKVFVNDKATNAYGSIIGLSDSAAKVSHTYATVESSANTVKGSMDGWALAFETVKLKGIEGYRWTTLNFDKYWSAAEKTTPVLKSFAGKGATVSNVSRMVDTSWYDESKDSYVLSDVADLYGFAYLSNGTDFAKKTIKLGADIAINSGNAADWSNEAPANEWMSISTKSKPFAGTFDGQMHTISGVYVNTDVANSGLFSATGETSIIKNLKLTNSYITSTSTDVGSIAGQGRGTFDSVYSDAIVIASKARVGGLVGMSYGTEVAMKTCWFDGTVKNTANDKGSRGTGGLIGVIYDGGSVKMEGCLNTGNIDVTAYTFDQNTDSNKTNVAPIAGGLVGYVKTKDSTLDIKNCLNTGEILVSDEATGGYSAIVGLSENVKSTTVSTVYSTVNPISKSMVTGKIYKVTEADITGYKGYQWTFLDFDTYWAVVPTGTPILKAFASEAPSLANVERMLDISWADKATGTKEDPYILSTKQELYGLAMLSLEAEYKGFEGKYIELAKDIVVNEGTDNASTWGTSAPTYTWTPIGSKTNPFAGTFDGDMHSISGLYLNTADDNIGLFAATKATSTIKNLKLVNSYFESSSTDVGSIAGQGRGKFYTVYSNAIVVGSHARIGGLIGMAHGTKVTMKNCWFDGSVTNKANEQGKRGTGGLIGVIYDGGSVKMEGCLNTGTIDVTAYTFDQNIDPNKTNVAPIAGGLVGYVKTKDSTLDIKNCLNAGEILVSDEATGGYSAIVGLSENVKGTTVSKIYSTVSPVSKSMVTGKIFLVSDEDISGYNGYRMTVLDFDNYWTVYPTGTPILKSFASDVSSLTVERLIDFEWLDEADGTEKDPYIISTKQDLYGLALLSVEPEYEGFAGKYFKLEKDIAVNEEWVPIIDEETGLLTNLTEEVDSWIPIGSKVLPFAGTFDGDMHTISGLYLKTDVANSGLFAATGEDSVIKRLKLEDSYIESTASDVGSIAGQGRGNFDTVYSNAIVVGAHARIGGFIGMAYGTKVDMENCWFDGNVTNKANEKGKRGTGGLIGVIYDGGSAKLTGCLNTGTIDVTAYTYDQNENPDNPNVSPIAGGLVGYVKGEDEKSTLHIANSLSTKAVLTCENAKSIGSILGLTENKAGTTVSIVYSTVEKATGNSVTGRIYVEAEEDIKGYDGYSKTVLDFDDYWAVMLDDASTTEIDELGTPILKSFADTVPNLKDIDKALDITWLKNGDGSKEKPYTFSSRADLYGFALLAEEAEYNGFAGKTFTLGADIEVNTGYATNWAEDAPEYSWTPIGSKELPFAGIFDGDGHTISGIYVNTNSQYGGLFGVVETTGSVTATIQNLKLKNSYFETTKADFGSIAGRVNGVTFDTIYSDAIVVSSNSRVGGFIGIGTGTVTMNSCWFAGNVKNTYNTKYPRAAAFVGNQYSDTLTITNCLNTGTVDVSAYTVDNHPLSGSFVGEVGYKVDNTPTYSNANVTITDCLNTGKKLLGKVSTAYGEIIGYVRPGSEVDIDTTYIDTSNGTVVFGYNEGTVTVDDATIGNSGKSNTTASVTHANMSGETAKTNLAGFDFDTVWTTVLGGTPVLTSFKSEAILPDTSWHITEHGSEDKPYLISDRNDLYGLAILSKDESFAGEYFVLTQDIVVNDGDADDWDEFAPKFEWTPIGQGIAFGGHFSGKDPETEEIHSISGLYLNTSTTNTGLFAKTANGSSIENLKLENSYFYSSAGRVGSIAGEFKGILNTVYSDAIVVSSANYAGGLVAMASNSTSYDVDIINSWFAGTVANTSTANKQYVGGFVAFGYAKSLDIINCLNTGTVDVSACTDGDYPFASGMVGYARCETNITSCLNAGSIEVNDTMPNITYGAIVGYIHGPGINVDINQTYTDSNKCAAVCGYNNGSTTFTVNGTTIGRYAASKNLSIEGVSIAENVTGEAAKTGFTELDFSDEGNWVVNPNGTPILKSFE